MAILTHNNRIPSSTQYMTTQITNFVTLGVRVSEKLEIVKITQGVASFIIKISEELPYHPVLSSLTVLKSPLSDVKLTVLFFKGFKSFESILKGSALKNWESTAMTVSGLSLSFFNAVGIYERYNGSQSPVSKAFAKVPLLNTLPFAGALNLATLGLNYALLSVHQKEKNRLANNSFQNRAKIEIVDLQILNTRIKIAKTCTSSIGKLSLAGLALAPALPPLAIATFTPIATSFAVAAIFLEVFEICFEVKTYLKKREEARRLPL